MSIGPDIAVSILRFPCFCIKSGVLRPVVATRTIPLVLAIQFVPSWSSSHGIEARLSLTESAIADGSDDLYCSRALSSENSLEKFYTEVSKLLFIKFI